MLGEDAAAIVNSAPIDPDFQQGCSHSGPLLPVCCYGAPGFLAQRTVRYFWDATTHLFGKVSCFGPGWLFYTRNSPR
eukprot:COSAG01_NODE_69739_length_260_cov_1.229814_1_plen_76_part_01